LENAKEVCSYVAQEELKVVNLVNKNEKKKEHLQYPFKSSKSYNLENRTKMERKFSNSIILKAFTLLILIMSRIGMILFHPEYLKRLTIEISNRNGISIENLTVCIETTYYICCGKIKKLKIRNGFFYCNFIIRNIYICI
jgi:hypothetical protein